MGGRVIVKVDGVGMKEVLKQIGPIAEILDADAACGKCGSHNIYPSCRSVKSFDYYSLTCSDCGAALSFGQRKDGGLWAKRKDEHGNMLDHRGWKVYLAIEAPKQAPAAAGSSPRQQAQPDAEELLTVFRRIDDGEQNEVFLDLCDYIRQARSDKDCDLAWTNAIKKHGEPNTKDKAKEGCSRAVQRGIEFRSRITRSEIGMRRYKGRI